MSSFVLRCIAVLTMLADHIGFVYGIAPLRVVGRISLPIFAFLIANGFRYTGSRVKYALRLSAFAVLSEIPYDMLFGKDGVTLFSRGRILIYPKLNNVFFTLLAGLLYLMLRAWLYRRFSGRIARLLSVLALFFFGGMASFCSNDYGLVGVFTVALFGVYDVQKPGDRLPLTAWFCLLAGWNALSKMIVAGCVAVGFDLLAIPFSSALFSSGAVTVWNCLQLVRIAALPLLFLYNGKSGISKEARYYKAVQFGFYAFYPLHILILWGLQFV